MNKYVTLCCVYQLLSLCRGVFYVNWCVLVTHTFNLKRFTLYSFIPLPL